MKEPVRGKGDAKSEAGYAVIWCRDFRLQALKRRGGRDFPVALVDDAQRQSIVLCCNALAARSGVAPGMPSVQALARCAALRVERPSEASELVAARFLLEMALAWVPGIEETAPGILTLDLSTQPASDWTESAYRLRDRLARLGLEVVVGLGETPALARIAAQAALHEEAEVWQLESAARLAQLDRLPVLVAEGSAKLREKLQLWGLVTLGSFARLQREEVAARLGDEGVELWLRLTGRLRRPLSLAKLEELFEEQHDFEYEVHDREPLFFLLRRFIGSLAGRVAATGRGVAAVHWLVSFADGTCQGRRLALPEPSLDEEVLFRLASGPIEGLEMKAAVIGLRLRFEPSDPVSMQRPLFGKGLRNRHLHGETLTRMRKIVGPDRLGSPRRIDTHRPGVCERAPLAAELVEADDPPPGPPVTGPTLRRYPLACRTNVQLRDGKPLRVESARLTGVVIEAHGPWKSGGDWWHRGQSWERSEWDVDLLNHGLFRLVETPGGWSLEGYYD
ncbi:MAG: DNA polymerase Y family protein [Verrucomicrobiales bacterium]|nr:DNA polymerase Y family protein [Verrucomicrobiales bacterium]